MDGLSVVQLDDTGNIVIDENGMAVLLKGADAVRQNVELRIIALRDQGFLGVTNTEKYGVKWIQWDRQNDPEPGILGYKVPDSYAALSIGLEAGKAAGVKQIKDINVQTPTDAERAKREKIVNLIVGAGTEDFPVSLIQSLGG